MANKNDFMIRLTKGSGVLRNLYYLQPDGTWGEPRNAAGFKMRREAYNFAREQLGSFWMNGRVNAIRMWY